MQHTAPWRHLGCLVDRCVSVALGRRRLTSCRIGFSGVDVLSSVGLVARGLLVARTVLVGRTVLVSSRVLIGRRVLVDRRILVGFAILAHGTNSTFDILSWSPSRCRCTLSRHVRGS